MCNNPDAGEVPDISDVMSEARCTVSVHPPHVPDTNQIAPEEPALIIGPSGIFQARALTAEELALFAPDDRFFRPAIVSSGPVTGAASSAPDPALWRGKHTASGAHAVFI
jgi:hypothetical protein